MHTWLLGDALYKGYSRHVMGTSTFSKRLYHRWWFWLAVLLLAYGTYKLTQYIDYWGAMAPNRIITQGIEQSAREREARVAELNSLYTHDTVGGTTPEETWGLFIEALKAGNTDLAAQYFIPEYQDKWRENFAMGKENGALDSFLNEDVTKIVSSGYYDDNPDWFEFATSEINNGPGMVFTLVRNPLTNIWKIYDL